MADVRQDTENRQKGTDDTTADARLSPGKTGGAGRVRGGKGSAKSPVLAVFLRYFPIWLVLLAALAGLRSHTFRGPILHDEAIFIYGGQAWANGQMPYRDFWDHKPPHIFLFHSIPLRFFPFSRTAILVHELLWLALAGTLLVAVCRQYLSWFAALAPLPFFLLFVSSWVTIRSGGLTEESSLAFVALSYLFVLRPSKRLPRDALLAGLFMGMAAQFRQTFAPSLLFLAVAVLWRSRRAEMTAKRTVGALLLTGLGFALPEIFWSAYFALKGIWREYIEASYLFNFVYIGAKTETHAGFVDGLREHARIFRDTGPILAAPIMAIVLSPWLPRKRRWLLWLGLLAYICEFAPVSISGEYYHHYYIQATMSSCLLLALAGEAIWNVIRISFNGSWKNWMGWPKLAIGALVSLVVLAAVVRMTVPAVRVYKDRYRSVLRKANRPTGDFALQKTLAKVIPALTEPDETILLLGVQPNACYFVARRYAGARYFHNSPFFKGKFQDHVTAAMRERMMADLRRRRPALIILGPIEGYREPWCGMEIFDKRPAAAFMRPYIEENYVPLEEILPGIQRQWRWYRHKCSFLVRKDLAATIKARFAALKKGT